MWPLLLTLAHAHVGDLIIAIDLERGASPAIDVEVSVGLTFWEGDTAQWVCHEAITAPKVMRSPLYTRSGEDVRLGWLPDPLEGRDGGTLFRSADGCDWARVTEISAGVKLAAFTPHTAQQAWALTVDGQLWHSTDGAQSFAETTPVGWTSHTDGIAFGADSTVYLSGANSSYLTGQVGRSDDGGATWTLFDVPIEAGLQPPVELRVLWVDPNDAQTALLSVDQIGADTLYRTTDGGATWTEVYEAAITVVSVEQAPDGTLYGVGGSIELIRSVDAGQSWDTAPTPLTLGLDVADGVLLAVNPDASGGMLVQRWEDGSVTDELATWDVVQPLSCPAESHQATICEPLWKQLEPRLQEPVDPGLDTSDTGSGAAPLDTGVPSTGCGCDTSRGSPLPWLGLLLASAAGRRRRGATGRS